MSAFSIPPLTLEIVDDDIAAQTTDAIVNAANNEFWMGAGVAGAIKARGGEEHRRRGDGAGPGRAGPVRAHVGRPPQGPIRDSCGRHGAGPADLRRRSSRRRRGTPCSSPNRGGLASIAFPAFGTGVGGFPLAECARIMIERRPGARDDGARARHGHRIASPGALRAVWADVRTAQFEQVARRALLGT